MYRAEYPRPQFVRDEWNCLNGEWDFAFDDKCIGQKEHWEKPNHKLDRKIQVPFAFQSKLSGIDDQSPHDFVWYKRSFTIDEAWKDKEIMLHFGAVDYEAVVYVNGFMVGSHIGGSVGFSFPVTHVIKSGENELCVFVSDPTKDETIPRGKQNWQDGSHAIWYTRTTGIWQSVWLEPLSETRLNSVKITTDIDTGLAGMEFEFSKFSKNTQLKVEISFEGEQIAEDIISVTCNIFKRDFDIFALNIFRTEFHGTGWFWSPENPRLFDVVFTVMENGEPVDTVKSYFGMRKISCENGAVYLNNRPYYQKLVLDQGYWPEGLLTAPKDEDFILDIELCKQMGFNGCRKHQKVEDARFLYWADKLGFLVWGEIPAAPSFHASAVKRLTNEFIEEIERDYNHPCIVAWVPVNESWGVRNIHSSKPQQEHSLGMYHTIRSIDSTRPVISNDGWQMTVSDICAIHNYAHGQSADSPQYAYFKESLRTRENILHERSNGWSIYANGFAHRGEPVLLTEFGGIGFDVSGQDGWGYTTANSAEEFVAEYLRVMQAVYASEVIAGFCYTQIADVEQEINGLLTCDRRPKADVAKIKEINDGWHAPTVK